MRERDERHAVKSIVQKHSLGMFNPVRICGCFVVNIPEWEQVSWRLL